MLIEISHEILLFAKLCRNLDDKCLLYFIKTETQVSSYFVKSLLLKII